MRVAKPFAAALSRSSRGSLEPARSEGEAHLAGAPAAREALLRAMLDEFPSFFFNDRFWVTIGITIEASKALDNYSELKSEVASLRVPIYGAWGEQLTKVGWSAERADVIVRSGASLVAGLAIRRLWADFDDINAAVIEDWRKAHCD